MGTRIHLYAVPGLPLHVEDLMPQSLLARCAGGLTAHGHDAQIMDFGSADGLEGPETFQFGNDLREIGDGRGGWYSSWAGQRRRESRIVSRFRSERLQRILHHVGPEDAPALVVLQISRRKDVLDARGLARLLRARHPEACIAIAGNFVDCYARGLLAGAREFDVACVSPAESVLAGLARSLGDRRGWEHIPGLVFRAGAQLAVGSLGLRPLPPDFAPANYHPGVYPGLLDGGKIRLFTMPHSTGSAHVGHYRGDVAQRPVHIRDVRQLRSEMLQLHELFGARVFHFTGTHCPRDAVSQLAGEIMSLPFDARYSREAHVCAWDADLTPGLAQSGCRSVEFCALTGSQRLLSDFYGEEWTISLAEAAFRACKSQGIRLHTSFVFPCPADDYHSRAETLRIIRRSQPDTVGLSLPELPPGSAWRQHAPDFGYAVSERKLARWICEPAASGHLVDESADLPFSIGSFDRSASLANLRGVEDELKELGIGRGSGAAEGLMADIAGWSNAYVAVLRRALVTLDLEFLHDAVERFNARATASINALDLSGAPAIRKAVGD